MSRFYASIQGNRGEATRQGSKASGIGGHIRGWDIGARVLCYVDDSGNDKVIVTITGGSNNSSSQKNLGTFKVKYNKQGATKIVRLS